MNNLSTIFFLGASSPKREFVREFEEVVKLSYLLINEEITLELALIGSVTNKGAPPLLSQD